MSLYVWTSVSSLNAPRRKPTNPRQGTETLVAGAGSQIKHIAENQRILVRGLKRHDGGEPDDKLLLAENQRILVRGLKRATTGTISATTGSCLGRKPTNPRQGTETSNRPCHWHRLCRRKPTNPRQGTETVLLPYWSRPVALSRKPTNPRQGTETRTSIKLAMRPNNLQKTNESSSGD